MLFKCRNYDLVRDREKTYLTADVDATATTLTVKAVDSNAWANNDYVIVGEIGTKNAEIVKIGAAVSDGTSLTVGACAFAHSNGEPVYRIGYNQVVFYRNTTDSTTGVVALADAKDIQPDDEFTRYEDTTNSTGYGFVRYYNSTGTNYSEYSDGIPYTGYPAQSLGRMMRMVRRHLNEPDVKFIDDQDIIEEINEKQRDIAHERLWPFYEDIFSSSRVADQRDYSVHSSVAYGKVHNLKVDSEPLAKIDDARYAMLHWDTDVSGEPTHFSVWNNKIRLYPRPASAASSTTLNGGITATDSSITLTSVSGFRAPGRALIESEVVSYETIDSTNVQLDGCQRGLEGTTAAAHNTATAITERDIIYTANKEPTELVDPNDATTIPDPLVLVYGAAMELAAGKLNDNALHDRLQAKYTQAIERLRDKFGKKATGSAYRIKDKDEYVRDLGAYRNPNDFPTDIG